MHRSSIVQTQWGVMVSNDTFVHHATTLMPDLCPQPPKLKNLSDTKKADAAFLLPDQERKKKI